MNRLHFKDIGYCIASNDEFFQNADHVIKRNLLGLGVGF